MHEALAFALAFGLSYTGFAMLALSQARHWHTVMGPASSPPATGWRAPGLIAQVLCAAWLIHGHGASFGSLLTALTLSACALAISLTLSWQAARLRPVAQLLSRWRGAGSA